LIYFRIDPSHSPPKILTDEEEENDGTVTGKKTSKYFPIRNVSVGTELLTPIPSKDNKSSDIPFESVSFAFRDIFYRVTLPGGEELDLLKGVTGHFEPGTVTALMGSSGAGMLFMHL
jgi:ABC-type multidrug transport system fused ATPase/permease subunit